MKNQLWILLMTLTAAAGIQADQSVLLTEFDRPSPDLDWRVVNDNVMGGRSRGGYTISDGVLVFSGSTNTHGGGFASIRTARAVDMTGFDAIRLKFRGDGRGYTFRVATAGSRVSYWASFPTRANEWHEAQLSLDEFQPNWRGRKLAIPPPQAADVRGLGIMIYDNADGPFRLEVDWIKAVASTVSDHERAPSPTD